MSAISGFESLVVDNFVTRRFNTLIFSGLESLLEEYFLIRRFNTSIFSSLERLLFVIITYQPSQCTLLPIKNYTHSPHNHYRYFLMKYQSLSVAIAQVSRLP